MCTSYVTDDEPTTATMNSGPFTFTQAHLSQEKTTRKRETEEQIKLQEHKLDKNEICGIEKKKHISWNNNERVVE